MKKTILQFTSILLAGVFVIGCQKMDQPPLGDFLKDANPPNGPLKFYVSFNGTTSNSLMNAVDSIKANFPSDNPLKSVDGVSGKAIEGAAKQFIKYPSFNTWANSSSFTLSVWIKRDGQTKNNKETNGPEFVFSLRGSDKAYHWSNAIMFFLIEGNNTKCALKTMTVSPSIPSDPNSKPTDKWFEWAGAQSIVGILDNNWHHIALVYDAAVSGMTLYTDGVANPNIKTWTNHGGIALTVDKIGEYRIGRGPRNDDDGDGEGGWLQSSYKGSMDEFRLYSIPLSATEVQSLFNRK